jgi:hypothetical protein
LRATGVALSPTEQSWPLHHRENPRQRRRIDAIVDDYTTPTRQHDLYPTRRRSRTW